MHQQTLRKGKISIQVYKALLTKIKKLQLLVILI